jgi:hypothetical protein
VFKAMESRIQRTLVHLQNLPRNLLDAFRNRPSVHGAGLECPKDQEIERALQKVEPGLGRHGVDCLQYKSVVVDCQQQDFLLHCYAEYFIVESQ